MCTVIRNVHLIMANLEYCFFGLTFRKQYEMIFLLNKLTSYFQILLFLINIVIPVCNSNFLNFFSNFPMSAFFGKAKKISSMGDNTFLLAFPRLSEAPWRRACLEPQPTRQTSRKRQSQGLRFLLKINHFLHFFTFYNLKNPFVLCAKLCSLFHVNKKAYKLRLLQCKLSGWYSILETAAGALPTWKERD